MTGSFKTTFDHKDHRSRIKIQNYRIIVQNMPTEICHMKKIEVTYFCRNSQFQIIGFYSNVMGLITSQWYMRVRRVKIKVFRKQLFDDVST